MFEGLVIYRDREDRMMCVWSIEGKGRFSFVRIKRVVEVFFGIRTENWKIVGKSLR